MEPAWQWPRAKPTLTTTARDAVPITVIEPSPVEIQKETRCGWDFSFNPFNFGWRFKLEGTVTAIHTVDAVTVKGSRQLPKLRWKRHYREFAGEQDLGRMSVNDTKEFSITARDIAGFSQASIIKGCDYEFEWEHVASQCKTGGAVTAINPTSGANASHVFAPLLMRGNYLNPVLDAAGVPEWFF